MKEISLRNIHLLMILFIFIVSTISCYNILSTDGFILYGDFTLPISLQRFFDMHYPLWNQYGSVNSFEFIARLSFRAFPIIIANLFSIPADLFYKIMVLGTMVLSGVSMYFSSFYLSFKRNKKIVAGALAASFIYMLNFKAIHTIIWPTLHFAYALAPLALVAFIKLTCTPRLKYALLVTFSMTLIAGSPHYLVFVALLMLLWLAFYTITQKFTNIKLSAIKLISLAILLFILINSFWLFPFIFSSIVATTPSPDTALTLESVSMLSRNSDIINTLRLTDIWWQHSSLMPEKGFLQQIWILASFLLPILAFSSLLVSKKEYRKYAVFFCVVSVAIIFLSTGTNNAYPDLYSWLTLDMPFGWLLRSPNKLTMILAMTFSFLCGITLTSVFNKNWKKSTIVTAFALIIFSISVIPMAGGYLYGVFTPVQIPHEYFEANAFISDAYDNKVLWLPLSYSGDVSWAPQKLVGLVDVRSSSIPTISSFNSYSKSYLDYVLTTLLRKQSWNINKLLGPLNVRYIVFHDDTSSYEQYEISELLKTQNDLTLQEKYDFIYVFENPIYGNNVNTVDTNILATGGLDKLISLTAINSFDTLNASLVFLEQTDFKNTINNPFNALILDTSTLGLVWSSYNEKYTIAPFDETNHHNPSQLWSKAMTSDPLHSGWHSYLEQKNLDNWDFDYGRGLVFTWSSSRLKETPTPNSNDIIDRWNFDSTNDLKWKNYTIEDPRVPGYFITLDDGIFKAELWNSTWGWKTVNSPLIPTEYGNCYRWELQVKGENAHIVHINIVEYNQNQKIVNSRQVKRVGSGNFDWQTITIDYPPENPETKYIQLQVWHGHETTQPLPNKVWIDNVKLYDLRRFVGPVSLEIPFTISETGEYVFLTRLFQNQQGGKIQIQLDNEEYVINTKDQLNKFKWKQIDTLNLTKGNYKTTLTNLKGFNAVNLFALIPKQEYQEAQRQLEQLLQDKRIIYILEAESDLYHRNSTASNKYGGEASNGRVLELYQTSKVWNEIDIIKPGNHTLAIRSKGNLTIKIDEKEYTVNSTQLDWAYLGSVSLDKGKHEIEITSRPTHHAQWNFENYELQEWKGAIPRVQTLNLDDKPYEGKYSIKAELNASTRGWKLIQSPLIAVNPETKYSWDFYVTGENAHKVHAKIIEYDINKEYVISKYVKGVGNGNFTWKNINFDYTPSQNATYLGLQIWHGHETDKPLPNKIWIDDVTVRGYFHEASELDVVWLYSTQKENETLGDIFTTEETPAEIIEYQKIDPTKYMIRVNATKPFILSFAEAYDPLWVAYVEGEKVSSIPLYSVINGFWINKTGELTITIEYEPQRWFYYGSAISITTLLGSVVFLIWDWKKRNHNRSAVQKACMKSSFELKRDCEYEGKKTRIISTDEDIDKSLSIDPKSWTPRPVEEFIRNKTITNISEWLNRLKQPKLKILDVGAGRGTLTSILPKDSEITALDVSLRSLRWAKQYLKNKGMNVNFIVGDAENLPFRDSTFDACTFFSTLHHLQHPNCCVKEVSRVLKAGGRIFSHEPHKCPQRIIYDHKVIRGYSTRAIHLSFREKDIYILFKKYGFTVNIETAIYLPPILVNKLPSILNAQKILELTEQIGSRLTFHKGGGLIIIKGVKARVHVRAKL